MKKIIIAAGLLALSLAASAQKQGPKIKWPDYKFTTVLSNPVTPVKNQYRSGTCWSFSTMGFVEAEIIRLNSITDTTKYPSLSPMFIVAHSYSDRAEKYVRVDGNLTFGAGSVSGDVLHVIRDYGFVPYSEMTGMNYGTEKPEQAELDAVLKAYVKAVAANPNKTLTTAWKRGFDAVVEQYLGAYPRTFEVNGKLYTPETYRDALKFNPDDYVSLTSFSYQPLYRWNPVEVADNWRWDPAYNVTLEDLMGILDNALEGGFCVAWSADVSEPGFTRDGLAVLVDVKATNAAGSDQEHWVGKDEKADTVQVNNIVEKTVDDAVRQLWYDNKTVTDDHGMLLYGKATDQWGGRYYIAKNSWGETGKYKGMWYASENFVKGQTLMLTVHKDALPKDFVKKHPNVIRKCQ